MRGEGALPWVSSKRHSPVRSTVQPLLHGALRRLATIPQDSMYMRRDAESLDKGRVTLAKAQAVVAWNALHPIQSRPLVYNLTDAGKVLRAVGLVPSRVHEVFGAYRLDEKSHETQLFDAAHLSAISDFTGSFLRSTHDIHDWEISDFLIWSERYDFAHLKQCILGGWESGELKHLIRQGTIPTPEQVAVMIALLGNPALDGLYIDA